MATKLKNLKIKKVDFVDEGANPDAHIKMIKRKNGEEPSTEEDGKKESGNILKKLIGFIGKASGMDQSEIDSAVDEIQKSESMSFNEKMSEFNNRKIADEMWDVCYALQSSFCSILNDETDGTNAATAMQESLDEFYAVVRETIPEWSSGKAANIVKKNEEVSEADMEIMKAAVERLTESIEKAGRDVEAEGRFIHNEVNNNGKMEGDKEGMGMKIDKSKMTDAERAFLESIQKRYGTEDEAVLGNGNNAVVPASAELAVTKFVTQPVAETASAPQTDEAGSIYKGLHPAVRAELEGLKKFREDAEARELAEVAKKYAIIGKKEDELVPLFKNLRAAGGTAYHDMIAILDQAVATVEKSGAFSEIGKSGHGSTDGSAWVEAEAKATELMKSKTGLSKSQALDEVFMENPELAARCEKEG